MLMNEKLTDDQSLLFQAWRSEALIKAPYLSPILMRLSPVSSNWLSTLAVDKHYRCYINFEFMASQPSVFGGQALLQDHLNLLPALGMQDANLTNIAGDAAINDDLRDAGCDELIAVGAVLPESIGAPDYLSAVEYYQHLEKKKSDPQDGGCGTCGTDEHEAQEPGEGEAGCPECGSTYGGCGSAAGVPGFGEMPASEDMDGTAPAMSDADHDLAVTQTAVEIKNHVSVNGRGSVPAGFSQVMEQVFAPTATPWKSLLRAYVRQALRFQRGNREMDRARVSRRPMPRVRNVRTGRTSRVIAPGYRNPVLSLIFARDTSASVSDPELRSINNEVFTLARSAGVKGEDMVVVDVDAEVHASFGYRRPEDLNRITGRGGTDMRKAVEFAEKAKVPPAVLVIATDGGTPWPEKAPSFPVIVLLTCKDAAGSVPSWAKVIEID